MIVKHSYIARNGDGDGPSTPWGPAQFSYILHRGVVFYSTAGHGGMRVSERIAEKYMTEYSRSHCIHRNGFYWFEEDCDINLPLYELSKNLPGFDKAALEFSSSATNEYMEAAIKRWNPDYPFAK